MKKMEEEKEHNFTDEDNNEEMDVELEGFEEAEEKKQEADDDDDEDV